MAPARRDAVVTDAHFDDGPQSRRLEHCCRGVEIQNAEPGSRQGAEGITDTGGVDVDEVGVDEINVFVGGTNAQGRGGECEALG